MHLSKFNYSSSGRNEKNENKIGKNISKKSISKISVVISESRVKYDFVKSH